MTPAENPPRSGRKQAPARLRLAGGSDILADAVRNYGANGDTNQAAAIAFYAILSIIPLIILTLLLIGDLFSADPGIRERLIAGIRAFIPSFSGALLAQFGEIEKKKDLLGGVGIVSLIWFSAMIFGALETALNIIFRSRKRRNYLLAKLQAIAMIPLGWAVGFISVGVTTAAAILARQPLLGEVGALFPPEMSGFLFRVLFPYLVTVLFFAVVYEAIPTAPVSLGNALMGSAIFSALMEVAKQFFTWYIAEHARYHEIFGSLEAAVILLIWVFYVAMIFLFSAELVSSYQRRDVILLEKTLLKPRRGVEALDQRLFRRFGRLYGPNAYVFREGDAGQELFYILAGRVRMEKQAGQVKKVLAEMGPGEYFGEMAALIQAPRTASARCLEECHIAVIDAGTLENLLRESGEVSLFMLREFSRRIVHTNAALESLTGTWVRLTAVLYFLRSWPIPEGSDPEAELAKITGKETAEIHEVLADLGRRGIMTLVAGRVTGFHRDTALQLLDEHAAT